jgi:hypothetical protein
MKDKLITLPLYSLFYVVCLLSLCYVNTTRSFY